MWKNALSPCWKSLCGSEDGSGSLDVSLLRLAKQQAFDRIWDALHGDADYDEDEMVAWLTSRDSKNADDALQMFKGESPLHVLLKYRPPPNLIEVLLQRLVRYNVCAVPETSVDMMGRTPLHVAAAYGADVSIIHRLLSGPASVSPATKKDSVGRYALHWACTNKDGQDNGDSKRSASRASPISTRRTSSGGNGGITGKAVLAEERRENLILVISTLLTAYPLAYLAKDKDGMTPRDLARDSGFHESIIELLELCSPRKKNGKQQRHGSAIGTDLSTSQAQEEGVPQEILETAGGVDDVSSIQSGGVSRLLLPPAKELK